MKETDHKLGFRELTDGESQTKRYGYSFWSGNGEQ